MSESLHGPAIHPETGGELWHYEWNGWMWCEREQEAFDYPESNVKCPHCDHHVHIETHE